MRNWKRTAEFRQHILEVARQTGNVTDVCRQAGIDRATFYNWKKRYELNGLEALRDLTPGQDVGADSGALRQALLDLTLAHPEWGSTALTVSLGLRGMAVSAAVVQQVLAREALGTKAARVARLEEAVMGGHLAPDRDQAALIERHNPRYRERENGSTRPGEILAQDSVFLLVPGVGRVHLQLAVDVHSTYVFALPFVGRGARQAAELLEREVLPFFERRGVRVGAVVTDRGSEFAGGRAHAYEALLREHGAAHVTRPIRPRGGHGFIEYVRGMLLAAPRYSLRACCREERDLFALNACVESTLRALNTRHRHLGYPNQGRTAASLVAAARAAPKTKRPSEA